MTLSTTELIGLLAVVVAATAIFVTISLWAVDKYLLNRPKLPNISVDTSIIKHIPRYMRVNIMFEPNGEPWSIVKSFIKTNVAASVYDLTDVYNWDDYGSYVFQEKRLEMAQARKHFKGFGILDDRHTDKFTVGLIIDTENITKPIKFKGKFHLSLEKNIKKKRKVVVKRTLTEHISKK